MSVSSQELISLYENRKRKTMPPSPYALFFLKYAKPIAKKNIKTITAEELIKNVTEQWKNLPDTDKEIFFKTSIELGFDFKGKFGSEKLLKIKNKIKDTKNKLNLNLN